MELFTSLTERANRVESLLTEIKNGMTFSGLPAQEDYQSIGFQDSFLVSKTTAITDKEYLIGGKNFVVVEGGDSRISVKFGDRSGNKTAAHPLYQGESFNAPYAKFYLTIPSGLTGNIRIRTMPVYDYTTRRFSFTDEDTTTFSESGVTASGVSQTLIASNAQRKCLIISNHSAIDVAFQPNATAILPSRGIKLPSGSAYEFSRRLGNLTTSAMTVRCASGSTAVVRISEGI